jgi:hypothetical protein
VKFELGRVWKALPQSLLGRTDVNLRMTSVRTVDNCTENRTRDHPNMKRKC